MVFPINLRHVKPFFVQSYGLLFKVLKHHVALFETMLQVKENNKFDMENHFGHFQ